MPTSGRVIAVHTSGSVFIMDVNQSSSFPNPLQLTEYLQNVVAWVSELSTYQPHTISLRHRFGDEILLVARGYETAYLIAFYVMSTWAFPKHPPYFGVGYGNLAAEFPDSKALETWNSPIVKQARRSADTLKSEKGAYRQWLRFDESDEEFRKTNELLNEYAAIQDRFFKLQTPAERTTSALYTMKDLQEWIAKTLQKNRSTISRQVHKSNVDLLIRTKQRMTEWLRASEHSKTRPFGKQPTAGIIDLDYQIKLLLEERVDTILSHMEGG